MSRGLQSPTPAAAGYGDRAYSRAPSEAERKTSVEFLQRNGKERRQAAEDLAWTLMNTLEFVFKR